MLRCSQPPFVRKCVVLLVAVGLLTGLLAAPAVALVPPVETFDFNPQIAATASPGVWFVDRYAPAGFAKELFDGDYRLKLSISAADSAASRPPAYSGTFYNTQGRGYNIPTSELVAADVWVGADALAAARRTGLWAVAIDGASAVTGFPIIEFANAPLDDPTFTGFRVWDNNGWHNVTAVAATTGQWYTFEITHDADSVSYFIDGVLAYDSTFVSDPDMAGSVGFKEVMLQAYNFGADYVAYFDNVVPVPPTPAPFTVTTTAGPNGSITPANPGVDTGDDVTLTVAGNAGYHIASLTVDSVADASAVGLASKDVAFTDVVADHTVDATFAINEYTLTYAAGANGTITGTPSQTVSHGGSGTAVTAVPDAGYRFVGWSDGVMTASRTDTSVTGDIDATAVFAVAPMNVYRFYNTQNGSHFYTDSATERDEVIAKYWGVYRFEGVAFAGDPTGPALYRFYNRFTKSHFYTASAAEKDRVIALYSKVYTYEGTTFGISVDGGPGYVPVYRFYNRVNGSHFYTASEVEKATVIAKWPTVYAYEGLAFYVLPGVTP